METTYRNKNRGYQQLRVWQDAIEYYVLTCRAFRKFPYELKRVASQAIASAGESVSGLIACRKAEQIPETDFNALNVLAFKLENGLLRLVESLEQKQQTGEWIDSLVVKESNVAYG